MATAEYAILKAASNGNVWISTIGSGWQIDTAEKLLKKGLLKINPKESSTSGITYELTEKGKMKLKKLIKV